MIIDVIAQFDYVYIYGYSNQGRNAYSKFVKFVPNKVKGIVVTQHSEKTRKVYERGKPIYELQEIKASETKLFVIALNPVFHSAVKQSLSDAGFKNLLIYDDALDRELNSKLDILPKLELRFLSVSVGQACNLKCRDCANFAPFALKDNLRYSLDNIKNDLDRILGFFEEVDTFHIQGGEPFLYTDLKELLYYCKTKFGSILKSIQIATNGTIIPDNEVLKALKGTDTVVRISNYPMQNKADELAEILDTEGIRHRTYNFANLEGEWSLTGGIDYMVSEDEDVKEKVYKCVWNTCYMIENGIVGRCARSIPARTLQKMDVKERDYIILDGVYSMAEISRYFMFVESMECCRHCKGSIGEPIPPAIQI